MSPYKKHQHHPFRTTSMVPYMVVIGLNDIFRYEFTVAKTHFTQGYDVVIVNRIVSIKKGNSRKFIFTYSSYRMKSKVKPDQNDYYAECQDFQKGRYSEISQVGNTIE